jgi:LuxR family transcriptional regulator, maltose regulon positive regulatory protein
MLQPLLRTKTTIPPIRPRPVRRARLLERLQEGMRRALTLVIAPAGFGKTTLVAAWASSAEIPVAWLSLQSADCAPQRFLTYLIQSLQSISPRLGQTTLALMKGGSRDAALFALLNDLAEVEADYALILDDYHSVDGPEIGEILQFLLNNRPDAFHLVLITRVAPTFSLSRLRALDQVIEIGAADLRFSQAEMAEFLENCMNLHLSAADIARLDRSTEGWAVGLQLAALSLAHHPADWRLPAGLEHVFEYLAEQVLGRETPAVQGFLIKSALFDRFCIPLCEAVLGSEHVGPPSNQVADLLAYIERANLFLVPLDISGAWYRYHPLFADFLRRQLSTEQAQPLYRVASWWSEQNGLLEDAVQYAIQAREFERAAGLLENSYQILLQHGEQAVLERWISALPQNLVESRPRLWLAKGWARIISLDPVQAEACVQRVEALIPADEPGDRLRGEAQSLRIMTAIFAGRVTPTDEISQALVQSAERDAFLHSLLHFNLGLHHVMLGNTAQAVDALTETLRLSQSLNNPLVAIVAQIQLAEVRQVRGALGLAERTLRQGIRYAKDTLGEHTFLLGMPYVSYAELLREQNRIDESVRYAEQGIAYCQVWQPLASLDGQITLARIGAAQGRWDEAFARLERVLQVAESSASTLDDSFVALQLARLYLLRGDLVRARQKIQAYDLDKLGKERVYYHLWEMVQLVLLRAKILELGTQPLLAATVADELDRLMVEAERRERVTPVIEALILQAYALHATNRHAGVSQSLSRALTLGAQSGYIRIFADEGKRLLSLIDQSPLQIHAPSTYFKEVLSLLRQEASQPLPAPVAGQLLADGLTPLTRRELDVLELMACGKSNQEIAVECVLALNTVKKHVANILSKMGVANRTQAVLLARKLGWVK